MVHLASLFSGAGTGAAAAALLLFARTSAALEITYPTADSDAYWVACQNNTLRWTSNSSDPSIFSVALLNSNQTQLNGNFQIANSLNTSEREATIFVDCVQPGSYSVLLVNASRYSLNEPQVYTQSAVFELKPNGTTPASASTASSSESNRATGSSGDSSSSSNASSTTAGASATNAANAAAVGPSSSAAGLNSVLLGMATTAVVSLGLAASLF
ncbi:hypothetical protein K437DRAFT_269483 [Tilletiaria anomala UBC 951]|uniref:Yeast cell wall synthesis Kre9/Knh1-like N-terminal domain-containing protein n=1 Tax=Tilletiaria anomala (strain ATCC 24038 / CBS 436.72 / UBC 951) TaxID=1037660 RepID=A0A066VP34_TILAU|nr:uncharacterized protein K437DRAFT_269483 [Tilletiaria anomala UBC 951]KDN42063.1 hypothetical protein K437DRAFT_269483 [Tilletiaria anomala UBC 951]